MDYAKLLKEYAARRKRIVALHRKGLTDEAIGAKMRPPVTKQAVGKILRKEGVR
jgi:hypothetical protein